MSSGIFEPGTVCCICWETISPDTCAIDTDGVKWDTCRGKCAQDAGIEEISYEGLTT